MDLHKLAHELGEVFKEGHLHLTLLAGLMGVLKNPKLNSRNQMIDLGDIPGDNLPATFLPVACLPSGRADRNNL